MGDVDGENSAQWAIDLLTPYKYKQPFYQAYGPEIGGGVCGFIIQCLENKGYQPSFLNIRKHIKYCLFGIVAGHILKKVMYYRAELRDASMIDYIKRHPERFPPPPEKPLYRDTFEPWLPIR
ncbi:NADH dehydrogenase (ubiquinone) B14.5 B subunit [Nomia melanderi]|uniref:NADH dehydrogenase (ubiquinone) B14.5 B subunit n=1 Tax=Nomia melanderi TaxID=2448451 RepID=UPI0013043961|nr:NADH dehydrogenase [ubiquinone] 1 subunit C2-like [Nomia melanderi]